MKVAIWLGFELCQKTIFFILWFERHLYNGAKISFVEPIHRIVIRYFSFATVVKHQPTSVYLYTSIFKIKYMKLVKIITTD